MNANRLAQCFNEWMRRYTDEPEQFAREFQTVQDFLTQQANGNEPTYGQTCAEYLRKLDGQLPAAA